MSERLIALQTVRIILEMALTPTPSSSGKENLNFPNGSDLCAICLSPFQSVFVSEKDDFDESSIPVETNCKVFAQLYV